MDTLECDVGGDHDENEDADADQTNETDEDHLQQCKLLRASNIFVLTHLFVEGEGGIDEQAAWHVDGSLFGDGEDCGGDEDVPNSSPGWNAAEPALVARVGDDDVGPGHLKAAEGHACEDGDHGAGEREAGDVGGEEPDDGAVEEVVDNRNVETAEACERACLGAEVLDGCAHFGGDGLLLDEEEVGFDELRLLGLLVFGEERSIGFVGIGILGFIRCSSGSLDHGEGGYDIAVGVGDLIIYC